MADRACYSNSHAAGSATSLIRLAIGRKAHVLSRIVRRIAIIPVSLLIVGTIAFSLVGLLPGDPAYAILGDTASEERIKEIHDRLGTDQPLHLQYGNYLVDVARGDLGRSLFTNRLVLDDVFRYLPSTLELVVPSLVLSILIGGALGTITSYYRQRKPGAAGRGLVTLTQSIPDFLLAVVLIYVFFVILGIAPSPSGRLPIGMTPPERVTGLYTVDAIISGDMSLAFAAGKKLILPVLSLALPYSAYFAKVSDNSLAGVFASRHTEFTRSLGLSEFVVIRDGWRIARVDIVTYFAILFGTLLGGAALIEIIYGLHGFAKWGVEGTLQLDIPVIRGFIVVSAVLTLIGYLVGDIIAVALDPRLRLD